MEQNTVVRRRPRYILGTFWLALSILMLIAGISDGSAGPVLVSIALFAYSVYLYRGGRFGFIIW